MTMRRRRPRLKTRRRIRVEMGVQVRAVRTIIVALMFNAQDEPPSDAKEAARKGDACSCSETVVADHGPHSHTVVVDEGSGKVKFVD